MPDKVAVREVGSNPYLFGGRGMRLDLRGSTGGGSGDGSVSTRGELSWRLAKTHPGLKRSIGRGTSGK